MIIIHMLDGEQIEIHNDTILLGFNNDINNECFYLSKNYEGNVHGDFEEKGSKLATVDKRIGICGFLLSHDTFSIGHGEYKTMYFTSAVKCVEVR